MEKSLKNADTIAQKLEPALTRATNNRLEVIRKERQKKEEIKERRKAKAIAVKQRRVRGGISLSGKKEDENDIKNDTDPDQTEHKYLLQL